jgi:hypothetical protein
MAGMEWQLTLGADARILPGLMPERDDAGSRSLTLVAEVAMTNDVTMGKPIVGFLGGAGMLRRAVVTAGSQRCSRSSCRPFLMEV